MVNERSTWSGAPLPLPIHLAALAVGASAIVGCGLLFDSAAVSQGMALISLLVLVGLQRRRGFDHPEESLSPDAKVPAAVWAGVALVLVATIGAVLALEDWLGSKAGAGALFVGVATAADLPLRRHRQSGLVAGEYAEPGERANFAERGIKSRLSRWLVMGLLLWGGLIGIAYVISSIVAPGDGGLLLGLGGVMLIAACGFGLAWVHAHDRRRGSGRTS